MAALMRWWRRRLSSVHGPQRPFTSGRFWEPIHSASRRLRIRSSFGCPTRSALVWSSIPGLLLLPSFFFFLDPGPYQRRLFFPFTAAIQPWKPIRFFVGFSDHAYWRGFLRVPPWSLLDGPILA